MYPNIATVNDDSVAAVKELLAETAQRVDKYLPWYLPQVGKPAQHVTEAMRHSLAGGKRIRPLIVLQSAQTFGLPADAAMPTACGFELLHTATLIHDDLPAIDNSPLRRARPSCHAAFDEATAILAGDALIIAAYDALAAQADTDGVSARAVVQVIAEFGKFAGAGGVIGGEAADIRGEGVETDRDLLEYIHLNKTAKLFEAATRAGATLAEAADEYTEIVGSYGRMLGLLFQVTDDILDITSSAEALGKPAGADERAGKQTYPALVGVGGARQYGRDLAEQAVELIDKLPGNHQFWRGLIKLVLDRQA